MAFTKTITLNKNRTFTAEELAKVRMPQHAYANITEMLDDGFTQDELEMLVQVKHTQTGKTALPIINGYRCPATLWTESEYQAYKDARASGESKSTEQKSVEVEKLNKLLELVKDNAEAVAIIKSMMPVDSIASKLFGYEPEEDEKFSRDWIMYRTSDNERFANKLGSVAEFCSECKGLLPAILPAQLDKILADNPKYAAYVA